MDELKILRGDDICPIDGVVLHQPTVNEIVDFGEARFFSVFYSMCAIPSDMKSALWDNGIDFMKITDWDLFIMLSRNFTAEQTSLIFRDIDFSKLEIMKNTETDRLVLVRDENFIITEEIYLSFIPIVRDMIGYVLKREKAANKFTKQILIDEDRKKRNNPSDKKSSSTLLPIILSLVNTEEFSYTYKDAYDLTIYQLMKSYYQIQNKKSACALYQGSMSGFMDTSKIKKDNFSWLYDENKFK